MYLCRLNKPRSIFKQGCGFRMEQESIWDTKCSLSEFVRTKVTMLCSLALSQRKVTLLLKRGGNLTRALYSLAIRRLPTIMLEKNSRTNN